MTETTILFEDFAVGRMMGEFVETITSEQLGEWAALYPWNAATDGTVPASLATILMMRAYVNVVTPRPPGNLHAQQRMRLFGTIAIDEPITSTIECQDKSMAGARRKVELLVLGRGRDDRFVYDGVLTLFWAA